MLKNLVALRKERGISQTELAGRIGKEQPFISRIERRIDIVEFYAIAEALGISATEAYAAVVRGFPKKVII